MIVGLDVYLWKRYACSAAKLTLWLLFSFRKDEVLRKVGDKPEVQYCIDILKACNIWKAEKGLTGIEAIEKAFDIKDKNGQKRYLMCRGEKVFTLLF